MALVRRNSALKERELRGTRDLLNAETAFRPGRAVTENMKLNMAGSGDLIGGQQNPPSRLPGGVKLGGCYRAPCCSSAEQVMSAARDCQEMMHVLFYLDFSCTCPLGLIMNPYECIFFHLVSAGYGDL